MQLGLINLERDGFVSSELGGLIKRSNKTELYLPLGKALQKYAPFLIYMDFLSKEYNSSEAAFYTRGIFRIQAKENIIEKVFRNWGLFSRLLKLDNGSLTIPEGEKGLPSEYVANLIKAMRAEMQANIFLIETMSQQAFAYLTEKKIGIDKLADSLINYENDPKGSANKACQTFEHFLFSICEDAGGDTGNCNGVIELANENRGKGKLLKNQVHLCHGIGALRNMAHHDPDKETGKPWEFTPQGAIISALIVPTMIRSVYLHIKEDKQEF